LVRSEAKRRANRENSRKGGLVKSPKKRMAITTQIEVMAEVTAKLRPLLGL
jgi:hypothetical protein